MCFFQIAKKHNIYTTCISSQCSKIVILSSGNCSFLPDDNNIFIFVLSVLQTFFVNLLKHNFLDTLCLTSFLCFQIIHLVVKMKTLHNILSFVSKFKSALSIPSITFFFLRWIFLVVTSSKINSMFYHNKLTQWHS